MCNRGDLQPSTARIWHGTCLRTGTGQEEFLQDPLEHCPPPSESALILVALKQSRLSAW